MKNKAVTCRSSNGQLEKVTAGRAETWAFWNALYDVAEGLSLVDVVCEECGGLYQEECNTFVQKVNGGPGEALLCIKCDPDADR